jgi:ABC-2 type transport system permease protein
LLACRQICTRAFSRVLTQLFLLGFIIKHFNYSINWYQSFIFIALFFIGIFVQLGHSLLLNGLSFWFLRIDNINEAYFNIGQISKYPLSLLPKTIQIIFFTMLPIAYSNYIPLGVGLGKIGSQFIFIGFAYVTLLWLIMLQFWKFSLRNYSSASS